MPGEKRKESKIPPTGLGILSNERFSLYLVNDIIFYGIKAMPE